MARPEEAAEQNSRSSGSRSRLLTFKRFCSAVLFAGANREWNLGPFVLPGPMRQPLRVVQQSLREALENHQGVKPHEGSVMVSPREDAPVGVMQPFLRAIGLLGGVLVNSTSDALT